MSKSDQLTPSNAFRLWSEFDPEEPWKGIVEAKLYSDATFIGEISGVGPCSFLNTVAMATFANNDQEVKPVAALRVVFSKALYISAPPRKSDYEHYSGGDYLDEIAALAALILGARLKAGSIDREFRPGGDSLGRPIEIAYRPRPDGRWQTLPPQIPSLLGKKELVNLGRLNTLAQLSIENANALVKAARLYQEAVWIADIDPALAWLLLVSAVETAASMHGAPASPTEQLEAGLPKVYNLLQEQAPLLTDQMAELLRKYTGATKKFVNFIRDFGPGAPQLRPKKILQVSFEPNDMKESMRIIYSHRSNHLHVGTAFPLPMCQVPQRLAFEGIPDDAYQETTAGLGVGSSGAYWTKDDVPMLLHVFEYIVRNALLNWWTSLGSKGA